jgi:hypothetical protein
MRWPHFMSSGSRASTPASRKAFDLRVDVVAVDPERGASGRLELGDRGEAEREVPEADEREVFAEAVALLEPEPVAVESHRPREVGRVEDRERVVEAQSASLGNPTPSGRVPLYVKRANVIAAVVIATCGLLAVPSAVAKDFGPGDIKVCGRSQCVPIVNKRLLRILSAYYYGPRKVVLAAPVRIGARGFALRWRNGYTSAVVGGATLDRFRAQGFFCGRFVRGRWYRFPVEATAGLRKLTAGIRPLRVTAAPPSC